MKMLKIKFNNEKWIDEWEDKLVVDYLFIMFKVLGLIVKIIIKYGRKKFIYLYVLNLCFYYRKVN